MPRPEHPEFRTTLSPAELREHVLRTGPDAAPDDAEQLAADLLDLLYGNGEALRH